MEFVRRVVIKNVLIVSGMPVILIISIIILLFSGVHSFHTTLCPSQFVPIGKKCYYFSTDELPWYDAHFKCLSLNNSTLAVITKLQKESRIRQYLNKRPNVYGKYERWLGGRYNVKQKKWIWATSGKPLRFHAFSRLNPNNGKWNWHCIIIDPERQNKWNARNCLESKRYICQTEQNGPKGLNKEFWQNFNKTKCYDVGISPMEKKLCIKYFNKYITKDPSEAPQFGFRNNTNFLVKLPTQQNRTRRKNTYIDYICPHDMILVGRKCYHFSKDKLQWNDAQWACRDNKTRLAVINNRHQDNILRGFLNGNFIAKHERWIDGIFDTKQKLWKWATSAKPIIYNNFVFNDIPTNLNGWYYLTIDPLYDHKWNYKKLNDQLHYICQAKAKTVIKYGKMYTVKPTATVVVKSNENALNNYRYSMVPHRTTPTPTVPNYHQKTL